MDGLLSVNTWTYVVGTWDGTTMRLYKDGFEEGNSSPGGTMSTFTTAYMGSACSYTVTVSRDRNRLD